MESDWKLTPRQWEVLKLMSKGFTNPEISELLTISLGTVKAHVGAIIAELDVTNRTEAAVLYQETLTPSEQTTEESPSTLSLVILPFSDHSPGQGHQYFADGLSEELMCTLGRHSGFRIIARTTAFAFRHQSLSTLEITEQLKVWGLIEGSISIVGEDLRVNVQLVESKTGYMVWSEVYRSKLSNIFTIQQQISATLVRTLEHRLGTDQPIQQSSHLPEFEVYQQFLLGRSFWHQRTPAGIMQAIGCFQNAVNKDGNYALAYVGLADAYNQIAYYSPSLPKALLEQSQEFLHRALALEPNLAEALASQAYVDIHYHRDFVAAEHRLQQAIASNPSYTYGYGWLSILSTILVDLDRALDYAKKGQALDALSPAYVAHIGNIYRYQGKLEEAAQAYEEAISNEIQDPKTYLFYAYTLIDLKRFDEAKAIGGKIYQGYKDQATGLAAYAQVMGWCGEQEKARDILTTLESKQKTAYVPAMAFVWTHLGLDDVDTAIPYLEKAIEERIPSAMYLQVEPSFAPFHSHPSYPKLLSKLNLQTSPEISLA